MTDEKADKVVKAVLHTLWERRVSRHALETINEDEEIWEEMMTTMREAVITEVSKP